MPSIRYCLAAIGLAAALGGPAFACSSPTEFPYDPTEVPSDAVIEGIVTSVEPSDYRPYANLNVSQVFVGTYPARTYRLEWWIYDASGMCEPPGPAVKVGNRVRIYLYRSDGQIKAQGWVLTDEYPKSKDQIQKDQAIALERAARQENYFQAGSALSYNDPKDWLKIEDIPELRHSKFPIYVSFTVGPNGAIEKCESGHVEPHQALDLKACKIIEKRARLVPPKFPEEAKGSFDMYAPEAETTPPSEPMPKPRPLGATLLKSLFFLPFGLAVGALSIWAFKRARSRS